MLNDNKKLHTCLKEMVTYLLNCYEKPEDDILFSRCDKKKMTFSPDEMEKLCLSIKGYIRGLQLINEETLLSINGKFYEDDVYLYKNTVIL